MNTLLNDIDVVSKLNSIHYDIYKSSWVSYYATQLAIAANNISLVEQCVKLIIMTQDISSDLLKCATRINISMVDCILSNTMPDNKVVYYMDQSSEVIEHCKPLGFTFKLYPYTPIVIQSDIVCTFGKHDGIDVDYNGDSKSSKYDIDNHKKLQHVIDTDVKIDEYFIESAIQNSDVLVVLFAYKHDLLTNTIAFHKYDKLAQEIVEKYKNKDTTSCSIIDEDLHKYNHKRAIYIYHTIHYITDLTYTSYAGGDYYY
jgi:hypothetical protein